MTPVRRNVSGRQSSVVGSSGSTVQPGRLFAKRCVRSRHGLRSSERAIKRSCLPQNCSVPCASLETRFRPATSLERAACGRFVTTIWVAEVKKRSLYIHVGPAKTGTSAVQGTLRTTTPPGLSYPKTGQWGDGAHHLLVWALAGLKMRGDQSIPEIDDLLPALVEELDAAPGDVLISSEAFNAKTSGSALLEKLSPTLDRLSLDPVVVMAVRDPVARISSVYNQAVKDTVRAETRAPDTFMDEQWKSFRTVPAVNGWKRIGLPVTLIGYAPGESFVQRFLALIAGPGTAADGALGDQSSEQLWPNRSISLPALITMLVANRALATHREKASFFESMCREAPDFVWQGPSFPFSDDATAVFLDRLESDLADLRELYGIDASAGRRPLSRPSTLSASDQTKVAHFLSWLPSGTEPPGGFGDLLNVVSRK